MRKTIAIAAAAALVAAASLLVLWKKGVLFAPDPSLRLVAVVNGQPITYARFAPRFAQYVQNLRLPAGKTPPPELAGKYLANMADTELLRQEAEARGLSVSPAEVERELASLRQDLGSGGKGEEGQAGGDDAAKLEGWKGDLANKLLLARLMEAVAGSVAVSDEEVKAYYEGSPAEFNRPPMARARQIVTAAEDQARSLRDRALAGEDFALLARASIAPEGERGGDLGLFAQGEMPEEIDAAVFALGPGQVSRVIKSPYGFHVIKVEERLPARTLTLEDAAPGIRARLAAARREESFSRWLPTLRSRSKIVLYPERLQEPPPE